MWKKSDSTQITRVFTLTHDESEDVSFRVSKSEYMMKEIVKGDELVKLENKMACEEDLKGMDSKDDLKRMVSKEDLKGMASKEDIQELKKLMNIYKT